MSESEERNEEQSEPLSKLADIDDQDIAAINKLTERIRSTVSSGQVKQADPLPPLTREDIGDRQSDRTLKRNYANWFFGLLIGQLLIMNLVFVLVGTGILEYQDRWVLELYLGGTLAEVFGIVYVITKNLFPGRQSSKK